MSNLTIYTVTTGIKFEGSSSKWIFNNIREAADKYNELVTGGDDCDIVTLAGPFSFGDNINDPNLRIVCRHDFDLFRPDEEQEEDSNVFW